MSDSSAFITPTANNTTVGVALPFNYGRTIWVCWYANGADVGSRTAFTGSLATVNGNLTTPATPGTYALRVYDAQTGGNLLSQGSPVTVTAAQQQAETGTLSGVPTSGSATVPLTGGTYTLTNGSSAYIGLFNVTTGAYQGNLQALSGASGSLPSLTPSAQDTFAYQLTSDSAGANVLFTSPNITVGAAPDVVLTGLPSSIAAGQPLASTYFTLNNGAYGAFILWDVTAGAQDDSGFVISSTVTPDSSLDFLVPQNAGHQYEVQLVTPGSSPPSVIWQSASFAVTAAPGALPAQISSFSTSNVTTTGLTLNWPAVSGATGYLVLARTSTGQKWGSLANTVVSSPSFAFTGLTAGSGLYAIVSPINANGRGPGNETIQSTASS